MGYRADELFCITSLSSGFIDGNINIFPFPTGKSPYLLFTNRHEIRRIHLLKSEYTQVVPTLKNAVALDVDVSTNKMFWCDLYHQKIYRYTHIQHAHTMTSYIYFLNYLFNPIRYCYTELKTHCVTNALDFAGSFCLIDRKMIYNCIFQCNY